MKNFIHNTSTWKIVLMISFASALLSMLLIPIILYFPGDSLLQTTLLVVIPSIIISMVVSYPVVYFYRKIIDENFNLIDKLKKDQLTGLLNRHTFFERYNALFENLRNSDKTVSLIMLDIDNFKMINDKYGHPAGDVVIMSVAELLKSTTRNQDLLCRYGGEEFLIVIEGLSDTQAYNYATRIQAKTSSSIQYQNQTISFTTSIGLAYFNNVTLDADHYIVIADKLMYQAKSNGKNRVTSNLD